MKHIASVLLCIAAPVVAASELTVRVKGAPDAGELVFQVYDSPNAFGDFRDPAREVRLASRGDGDYLIDNAPAGTVAVLVYADQNGNGLIDKNFIGIPKEPLGISNNYRPKGPPSFERASFELDRVGSETIDIEIYRVLGDLGRLGVGAGVIARSSPYVGSNETVTQPIPAITYNGERLQWVGPELRFGIYGSGRSRFALSASYRIGSYEEDDSPVLAGLGDRRSTLMAGLGYRYEIPGGVNLLLEYQHDALDRIGGGSARARVSKGFQAGIVRLVPQLSVNWLSAELGNHDYGVPPSAAVPGRPAYELGGTVSYEAGFGSFIELNEDWRIVLNVAAEFLDDEVTSSPIVAEDEVIKGFAAITYIF